MSVSPIRRLRLTAPLFAAVLGIGLLAGCAGQQAPGSYTDGVEEAFIEGCWTTLVSDANDLSATASSKAPSAEELQKDFPDEFKTTESQCTCAYNAIKKDVPFGDFKKINDNQTEKPSELPASFTKAFDSCGLGDATAG